MFFVKNKMFLFFYKKQDVFYKKQLVFYKKTNEQQLIFIKHLRPFRIFHCCFSTIFLLKLENKRKSFLRNSSKPKQQTCIYQILIGKTGMINVVDGTCKNCSQHFQIAEDTLEMVMHKGNMRQFQQQFPK